MSLFGRRRNFDRAMQTPSDIQPDLTGYEEKQVFTTDNAFVGGYNNAPVQPVDYTGLGGNNYAAQPNNYVTPQQDGYMQAQAPVVTEMRDLSVPNTSTERPMVFAMRGHSDIYIYEFSDRLEYYVRTNTKMFKYDTVYKATR